MLGLPREAATLLGRFAPAFAGSVFVRWVVLLLGAILTTGRRTVQNILRTVGPIAVGHFSSFHRVFSKRRWSMWRVGRVLATLIVELLVPDGVIDLVGDDTVEEHRGKNVYGKGCHRDAVRSKGKFTAFRWGHKWVVLCILVRLPFARRPWALPILVALYRSKAWNEKHGRRHKTPVELMRQLLAVAIRWFRGRNLVFAGDGNFNTHELSSFARRHRKQLTLVSRFFSDANLYTTPPPHRKGQRGRRRIKGKRLPSPAEVVEKAKRTRITVRWYGGGTRRIEIVTRTAHWYKAGQGLVPVRWVFVHDLTGTHRDEYFFSTDVEMTPKEIVETYAGRWNIETTFQEARAHLGLETTRGWSQSTVLRVAPCLFGLYSIVALLYTKIPAKYAAAGRVNWVGKETVSFSDAITAVRRWLWTDWVFATSGRARGLGRIAHRIREVILYALAPAA